ncbi:hypothetical protein [Streptomyces mirabilis]
MTHTAENRTDIAAAVVSLAAEATELETRATSCAKNSRISRSG